MEPTRVVLAEDHHLVRAGLRSLLEGFEGMRVIAEASDGREAVELVAEHRPDVVLMDIAMPTLSGLLATERIVRDVPQVRVLILSMHRDESYVRQAFQSGATGYLLKGSDEAELGVAIRAVARGERYVSPGVASTIVTSFLESGGEDPGGPLDLLTSREVEILQLVAEGRTSKQIAAELGISVKTVETHGRNMMQKLEISDIAGLVRLAIRTGLVSPEE